MKPNASSKDCLNFPEHFIWGTSTAGHQVEGGNEFSDWWVWEQKGLVQDGTVSGRAMDYWNRHEEDHALMTSLHYNGFRLGIEWARIEPQKGCFNRDAIEHYRRILQSLRNHEFTICLTLHHWVIPSWVADQDDWLNPDTLTRFLRYARLVIEELGSFPDYWEGIPILGYYHWSFVDNFEWREGFAKRFGLISVQHDDPDLTRVPRPSAYLYSEIAQKNTITRAMVETYAPEIVDTVFSRADG